MNNLINRRTEFVIQSTLESGEWYDYKLCKTTSDAYHLCLDTIAWDTKHLGRQQRSYRVIIREIEDHLHIEFPRPLPNQKVVARETTPDPPMSFADIAVFEDENTGDIWANNTAQGTWRRLSFTDYRNPQPPTSPCQKTPPPNPPTP